MDLDDNEMGLSPEQTEKLLQFQDLTGLEDMSICRDILQRHQWDLEVAIQEHMNIREGRPSLFATEARPPTLVTDLPTQQVYTEEPPENPRGVMGIFRYVINLVTSVCYNTVTSILNLLLSFVTNNNRRITDPLGDVTTFIQSYTSRYNPHPVFYQGTYSQALNDAKNELRYLIVYLHMESWPECQQFARNALTDPEVIEYINTHALFWACSAESGEGWRVAQALNARRYPIICVVCVRDHRMTVVARSEGPCSPGTLLNRLQQVVSDNEQYLSTARSNRVERELTAQLRAAQDEAFAMSLAADQEKERRREAERALRQQREDEEDAIRAREDERLRLLAEERVSRGLALGDEPPPARDTLTLLIRLPSGDRLTRRFALSQHTEDLYDFVFSHPESPEEFDITTNFPKRVLRLGHTLLDAGLQDRDVLFVSDHNA